jgi:hypothetical protein
MSGCPTGTEVGIAWLGTLYVYNFHSHVVNPYFVNTVVNKRLVVKMDRLCLVQQFQPVDEQNGK